MNSVPRVAVRRATPEDARAIAALHVASIREGFLATLGRDFLMRVYRRLSRSDHGALWVAVTEPNPDALSSVPRVAGFVALAHDTTRFYRDFLVRDGAAAFARNLVPLTRAVPRTFETLRYGLRGTAELPDAEILALAVDAACLRRGVARALLGAATGHLVTRGIKAARVVTTVDNIAARAAYTSAGFEPHSRTEVHRGVEQDVLVWRDRS